MGIKNFFKSDRCYKCKSHKGSRFCFRIARDICWECCNELRVDLNCPENCQYRLKNIDNDKSGFMFKTKADSHEEYDNLLKKKIDHWIISAQKTFKDRIPMQIANSESGRNELEKFLSTFNFPDIIPINYLRKRLSLPLQKVKNLPESSENIADKYLDKIIENDWEGTINLLFENQQYTDEKIKANYLQRISTNKIMKKIVDYEKISAALSENKKEALVFYELNKKYELTIHLKIKGNQWKIVGRIFGKPALQQGENEALRQIGVLLHKNQMGNLQPILQKYSAIYPDSADFQYYWGLYYLFSHLENKAIGFFFNAIEIEPSLAEAKYNLAYIFQTKNRSQEAKILYKELIKENPDDVRCFNNLASILIEEEKNIEAEKLLKQCLKLQPNFEFAQKNLDRINKKRNKK